MTYQYKTIIHNLIDWKRIEERLSRYTHIQKAFPLTTLQKDIFTNSPPYFCHPIAYILGIWNSEDSIQAFDELLAHAATIQGWDQKGRLNVTQEFQTFHTLRWELQVAKFLSSWPVTDIKWRPSGPDLEIKVDGQSVYIECYYYQKFYGKVLFLDDVLGRIDRRLHAQSAWALESRFPATPKEFSELLEQILPKLTPSFIENLEKQDEPYIYLTPPDILRNVHIFFENEHIQIRHHKVLHTGAGDTDLALEVALKEALKHKKDANSLRAFHPNIVAISMSMSKNFLLGRDRAVDLKLPPPNVMLPDNIDGAVIHVSNAVSSTAFDTVFEQGSLVESLWQKITGRRTRTETLTSVAHN